MLPTNQAGDFITPENVLHSLITRLVKLKNGLRKSNEIEINYKEIIDEIKEFIYGFRPEIVLPLIAHSEELLRAIIVSNEGFYKNIDVGWGYADNTDKQLPETVKDELDFYAISLTEFKEHFIEVQHHQSNNGVLLSNFETMTINVTVAKLSMLIHLLVGEHREFDKVINADKRMFARGLREILQLSNGQKISENTLCDKWSDEETMESTLQFWKERFNDYRTYCINLMRKKGFL